MQFYLNQKSLPMIRKCANCAHFNPNYQSCSLRPVLKSLDHSKKIFLQTDPNLYCHEHEFKNEEVLREHGMIAEYPSVQDALKVIERAKEINSIKKGAV